MTTTKRLLAVLACVVLSGSCAGDGEPSANGAADGVPVGSDSTSQAGDAEAVPPRIDLDDPGVDEGLEGAGEVEAEDVAGFEDEELVGDVTPEPLRSIRIPAGTRINTAPDEDISTAEYRVDDPVIVTVTHDVLGPGGQSLLPQGVRLLGRVRASMGSGGPGENAVLEIDFETLSADRYERPIEGAVVNRPVIPDPVAARRRRSASGRVAAVTVVPGLIMAGTIIVVELRAPVYVPPFVARAGPLPPRDSVLQGDSVPRRYVPPFVARAGPLPPRDSVLHFGGNPWRSADWVESLC